VSDAAAEAAVDPAVAEEILRQAQVVIGG